MEEKLLYTEEQSKETKKWTPAMTRQAFYFPVVFYIMISGYLLATPMDEWIFNLGQYFCAVP